MRVEDAYPLTPVQHGMLVRSLAAPRSGVYVQQLVCRFGGALDAQAFQEAWRRLDARHSIFRTSFQWREAASPLQRVHPEAELQFVQRDCSHLAEAQRLELLGDYLVANRRRGFELDQPPLSRHALFRFGATDHRWVWTSHHAVMDGRSRALVLGELFEVYAALCAGTSPVLSERPPFRRYVDWLLRQDHSASKSFWTRELDGFVASSPLGIGHGSAVGDPGDHDAHAEQSSCLSEDFARRLGDVALRHGLTPNTFLQAAWAILLSRYGGERDVAFGAVRAGRHLGIDAPDSMIGLLIHTVPLRTRVDPDRGLLDWLAELRSLWVAMREHEHVPLNEIRSWSQVPPGQPLFESLLTFENHDLDSALQRHLPAGMKAELSLVSRPDYAIAVTGALGRRLRLGIAYDRRRFERAAIARMLGHLENVLHGMVDDPGQRIGKLPLLGDAERRQLLVEWNDSARDYPADTCVHRLFEQQAERTPDAVAVVFDDAQLTYRELDARACQLARHLRRLGVGPEAIVGLVMTRSLEMIIGLLGILKAGGAYLPLHPSAPRERLDALLDDANALAVLTRQSLAEDLGLVPAVCGEAASRKDAGVSAPVAARPIVCLDTDWHLFQGESGAAFDSGVSAANLAYVIYTSGSTGKPKGVMVEHRQIVNYVLGISEVCGLVQGFSHAMLQPLAVDSSQTVIFPCFASGGTLQLIPEDAAMDPQALASRLSRFPIDVLKIAPSHLAALWQASPQPERLLPRRWLIVGGEPSRSDWVAQLQATARCAILNHYGPTEATVATLTHQVAPDRCEPVGPTVPIGRPLPNTEAYVLDRRLQPVPMGIAGELHLGGNCLARGYLGRPELTAEVFIPNPFSDKPGARLYRTGDVARYRADGSIELLGRMDQQVKIRGFRVEPAEVAAELGVHPDVRNSLVLAREDRRGDRQLVAYVVPRRGQVVSATALRRFLASKLPDYMVPAHFVGLDELPLTPHGKVDLAALPEPMGHASALEQAFAAPRTHTEEIVAGIWSEVLALERVGIHDHFLELGGHSLLTTRIASRLRNALQVELPLRELFANPTVAGIARRIDDARRKLRAAPVPPLVPVPRDGKLALSFAQQRLWFLDQLDPANPAYNVPGAVRITGRLDVAALERSLAEIVRRHEALRTTFEIREGIPLQVVSSPANFSLAVVNLADHPEAERAAVARELAVADARRPFDLARGPLLRPILFRLADDDAIFAYCMHHIVSDAWSQTILLQELSTLYSAFVDGEPSPLQPLPIQYADYAAWQRSWQQGKTEKEQLVYWREQLREVPVLALPTDRPHPARRSFRGAKSRFALPGQLTDRLRRLGRQEDATLFMTLLAAFQVLLHRYTGQDDIAVGSPVAGRSRRESEGLIGLFLNTLVFRGDLSGDPGFVELLRRTREAALDAYDHQDVPFERIVEELRPQRDPGRTPLFQVLFAHDDQQRPVFAPAGLASSPIEVDTDTEKFDLALSVRRAADGLAGYLQYNTDLFEPATIDRMTADFLALLAGIVDHPQQRVSELPILAGVVRHRGRGPCIETRPALAEEQCVHQLFERQVERTPDAVAVEFEGRRLSYRQLNARANQLAHHLRSLGAGPEELVAISMRRSIEIVVAALGVLKSGAAYVPVDPDYPADRRRFMFEDAQARLVVTQQGVLQERLQGCVCLDADLPAIGRERTDNPSPIGCPRNAAYVIYTSGSTGRPKGAILEHRPLSNLVAWQIGNSAVPGAGRTLQFASLSFDVSVQEIFSTLCSGGTLVLVSDEVRRDPKALLAYLSTQAVERIFLPFVALQQLACAAATGDALPAGLREVITAGEQLQSTPQVVAFFERAKGCRLVNQYGPTETHVTAAFHLLADPPRDWKPLPPIGRPIANAELHVLDRSLARVAIGRAGELYIGGACIGRGYLRRPDLTAERFIPDPFSDVAGARLYRTGDVARMSPDGNIEYLGRVDDQIKIRGYRIELGEIETVLGQHPAVRQCAVVAHQEDGQDGRRLVAFVVTTAPNAATGRELRGFLKDKLPEYMLPAQVVFVDALPVTPSGKLDRRALPDPGAMRPNRDRSAATPRTPEERLLASIWADVLRVDRVGVDESFFELGGHSLLAVQLASRISVALQRDVSVKMLFLHPTVSGLVVALQRGDSPRHAITEESPASVAVAAAGTGAGGKTAHAGPGATTLERRPLLGLLAAGRIAPVNAAALGYLSEETLGRAGLSREVALETWYDNLPTVDGIYETSLGRVAIIRLPVLRSELYGDKDQLVSLIVDALEVAQRIGARTVSLTGLLPSATDYGRAVQRAVAGRSDLPVVTTGHATTVSAVVLTVESALREGGRDLARESVAMLGVGSIGYATLRLMLRCLPHPRRILLCDVFGKRAWLDQVAGEIVDDLGFKGSVAVAAPGRELPPGIHASGLIIGATNVADILDVSAMKPGTVIVDDSAPHCFSAVDAIKRFEADGDILFTEGGVVQLPRPWRHRRYLPQRVERMMHPEFVGAMLTRDPSSLGSCVLSSLLSAGGEGFVPTLGLPDDASCLAHYGGLRRVDCGAAALQCDGYVLPRPQIEVFRSRFGGR